MIDFMDRDDQEMVNFQRELLHTAAANHLTVTFHGVAKPTGLERTYPNLLTSEGVLNLEYDKWDKLGVTPEHEVTIPFTRMLAGPLDFHQGSFRTVPLAAYHASLRGPTHHRHALPHPGLLRRLPEPFAHGRGLPFRVQGTSGVASPRPDPGDLG